jgi:hypothetical protein
MGDHALGLALACRQRDRDVSLGLPDRVGRAAPVGAL